MRSKSMMGMIVAGSLATACSSSPGIGGSGHACPALAAVGPAIAFPMPGATNVPTTIGMVLVGSGVDAPTSASSLFDVRTASGMLLVQAALSAPPSPLPGPVAPGVSVAGALRVPALPPLTVITVREEPLTQNGCSIPYGDSGSFTTGAM